MRSSPHAMSLFIIWKIGGGQMKKKAKRIFSKNTDDEISLVCSTTAPTSVNLRACGAYCDLKGAFCTHEQCLTCPLLHNFAPNHIWLCSTCIESKPYITVPYWEDVPCSVCGLTYGVMVCAKVKKLRT